ncbi:MAG: PfkB family carbohydrate kinase [Thermomicrobiales bacterium]
MPLTLSLLGSDHRRYRPARRADVLQHARRRSDSRPGRMRSGPIPRLFRRCRLRFLACAPAATGGDERQPRRIGGSRGQPTARAWQLFEPDERRIEVFRTDIDDFYNLEVRFPEMSDAYRRARGYHIGHGTLADMVELMANLRAVNQNAVVVWEPTPLQHVNDAVSFRAIFAQVDAFSPDVSESLAITGQSETEAAIHTLLDWGAKIVALRMGARGSRLYTPEGETISIPAAPASVVDTTGGGNAYLGGLLVALADGDSVADAGAKAAVSASFAIEQFGVPTFDERLFAEAETRLAWVKAHRAVIA